MPTNTAEKGHFAFLHTSERILPTFTEFDANWTAWALSNGRPGDYGITLIDTEYKVVRVLSRTQSGAPLDFTSIPNIGGDIERAATWALLLQHEKECLEYKQWCDRLNEKLVKGGCRPV
jgi:hypothetical protein